MKLNGVTSPWDFFNGLRWVGHALLWLFKHPKSLLLLCLPGFVGIFLTLGSWVWMISEWRLLERWWNQILWQRPDEWWWLLLYYPAFMLVMLGLILIVAVLFAVLIKILLLPLYDQLSSKVEREMLLDQAVELGFWPSVLAIGGELRVVFILLGLSLLTLIPLVGVVTIPLVAFVSGFDACNYCLARRRWSLKERIHFAKRHVWTCMGIGIPLTIPLVSIMMTPIVVVGGTLFTCEQLRIAGSDKLSRKLGEEA